MKIRINGKTIKTEDIVSISRLEENEFERQIYFSFDVELKNGTWCFLSFHTDIYNGILGVSDFSGIKPKEYWFKKEGFAKELANYKDVKLIAQNTRNEIESIWDKTGDIYPIPEFNSYKNKNK